MIIDKKSKGVWIMREEKSSSDLAKQEEIELEDPETTLYAKEPIFLVDEAPLGSHISRALELNVPVVVILTKNNFPTVEERMTWIFLNIPQIETVCIDYAGDKSLVQFIKQKWIKEISTIKTRAKNEDINRYALLKKGTREEHVSTVQTGLDEIFSKIFENVKKGNNNPPQDPPPGFLFKK